MVAPEDERARKSPSSLKQPPSIKNKLSVIMDTEDDIFKNANLEEL